MDYIFVTTKKDADGVNWDGERIHAETWDAARQKAEPLGVEVQGIIQEEHTYYTY